MKFNNADLFAYLLIGCIVLVVIIVLKPLIYLLFLLALVAIIGYVVWQFIDASHKPRGRRKRPRMRRK